MKSEKYVERPSSRSCILYSLRPHYPIIGQPLLIGELTFRRRWHRRVGNYRLYAWTRRTPHCRSTGNPSAFLNCELSPVNQLIRLKGDNSVLGLSLDQQLPLP